jgi:hypothetical protein
MIYICSNNGKTLLLRPSLHFTQLHFPPLQYTCRHFNSSNLNFIQTHFTTLSFGLIPFKFPFAPLHLTSLRFISLHFTSLNFQRFSQHLYAFYIIPFIIAFLTPFLKILGLQEKVSWRLNGMQSGLYMFDTFQL